MVLNTRKFLSGLQKLPESEMVPRIELEGKDPAESERLFGVMKRLMEAKTPADIADISMDDLLECWNLQGEYAEIFGERKAGEYFAYVRRNLPRMHTKAKRRVL